MGISLNLGLICYGSINAAQQQCVVARCAHKSVAMLTDKTSELTSPDLWPSNKMTFRTCAVTVLLCYFTYLHESNPKLRFLADRTIGRAYGTVCRRSSVVCDVFARDSYAVSAHMLSQFRPSVCWFASAQL